MTKSQLEFNLSDSMNVKWLFNWEFSSDFFGKASLLHEVIFLRFWKNELSKQYFDERNVVRMISMWSIILALFYTCNAFPLHDIHICTRKFWLIVVLVPNYLYGQGNMYNSLHSFSWFCHWVVHAHLPLFQTLSNPVFVNKTHASNMDRLPISCSI